MMSANMLQPTTAEAGVCAHSNALDFVGHGVLLSKDI